MQKQLLILIIIFAISCNDNKNEFTSKISPDSNITNKTIITKTNNEDSLKVVYEKLTSDLENKCKSLQKLTKSNNNNKLKKMKDSLRKIEYQFFFQNMNSITVLAKLFEKKYGISLDSLIILYSQLNNTFKEEILAKSLNAYINFPTPKIGDLYYDFEAEDMIGNMQKLSSFIRNKPILLIFHNTNCGACKLAIKEVVSVYKDNSDKIDIISFNTADTKKIFLEADIQGKYNWFDLWDGDAWYSEIMTKYGIMAVPTFYLISPTGIILDRWSGYSEVEIEQRTI